MARRDDIYGDVPFRIRVGAIGDPVIADHEAIGAHVRRALAHIVPDLFDAKTRHIIRRARHTTLLYGFVGDPTGDAEQLVAQEIRRQPHCPLGAVRLGHADPSVARYVERAQGKAIVDRCDVLIAIWDGDEHGHHNSGVVRVLQHADILKRPVITISTVPPYDVRNETANRLSAAPLEGIETLNRLRVAPDEQERAVDDAFRELFFAPAPGTEGPVETQEVADEAKRAVREKLLPARVRAESMAARNQRRYLGAGLTVYVLAPITVAAVAVATLFPPLAAWGFGIEFALLALILIIVISTDQLRVRRKWIESRFLAERLRAASFLTAAGVETTGPAAFVDLPDQSRAQEWVLLAFREVVHRIGPLETCWGKPYGNVLAFIERAWIGNQLEYHRTTANRARKFNLWLEYSGFGLFVLALLAAGLHVWLSWEHGAIARDWLHQLLTLVAIVSPAWGASLGGLRAHREYSRLEKRSGNMCRQLEELQRRAREVDGRTSLERLLRDTEELMLDEAQDWLMLMSAVRLHAH